MKNLRGTKSAAHIEWRSEQVRNERIDYAKMMISKGFKAADIRLHTGMELADILKLMTANA